VTARVGTYAGYDRFVVGFSGSVPNGWPSTTDHAGGAGHRCAAPVGANVPVGTFGHSTDPWTWEDGDRSC
jgi:hypothetical protein